MPNAPGVWADDDQARTGAPPALDEQRMSQPRPECHLILGPTFSIERAAA
jgi:hypothetical protein